MAVAPGTRFGPYEIVGPVGAGGMGEVYKARDTRLHRDVALKVLPAALTGEAAARERFLREARAAASLSHPNICTLHDVGETGDGRVFLVMELLHGETALQRAAQGPLDLAALVDAGIALADALETAHTAGIVHRDIKPANVVLTARGPEDPRFRSGPGASRGAGVLGPHGAARPAADVPGHGRGHGGVHVARAAAGRGARCAK